MRWRAPAQVAQMGPCPHARPCVGWRVCVRQNVPLEKILPHPMQTLRRNRCQTRTRPRKKGSMPFCVELDNLKDTDAPIHQPAAMLVAAD